MATFPDLRLFSTKTVLFLVTLLVIQQVILTEAGRYPVKKLQKQKQQQEDETHEEESTEVSCSVLNDPNCKTRPKKGNNNRLRQEETALVPSSHPMPSADELTLPNRYRTALNFAQYLVMELFRELGSCIGWKRNGWEMSILERVFKNVSTEMLLMLHLMLK